MNILFIIMLLIFVLSNYALFLLKKKSSDYYKEIGSPPLFWVGWKMITFLYGYLLTFSFYNKVDRKSKVICSFLSVLMYIFIVVFIYEFSILFSGELI